MENYRDQVIVIFAGYPDKMKTFLEQNEGLRSRIAFHLDFPDYSSDELVEILKLMAEKREYVIADDALPICRKYFEDASCVENFGNGRYVRNFLEQTIMRQSVRLQKEALAKADRQLTKEEMCLLTTEDLALLTQGEASRKVKMGFAS